MNTSIHNSRPHGVLRSSVALFQRQTESFALRGPGWPFVWVAIFAALLAFSLGTTPARAQGVPPGCSGSAIGISLFTSAADVHIGDTLLYSVSVFNGIVGNPTSCDASNIVAWVTTPDGVVHPITLRRTYLMHTQSDFYTNVVSYVARAQDIRPDGTLRATAEDTATIFQNDTPSMGGANQGVNTEVSQPCIQLLVQCLPSVGENGAIVFNGTVTNCGNNTLVGVTVTNYINGGAVAVFFPTNLLRGQSVSFTGSYIPADPCQPSTATLVAVARDQFTANPRTVVSTNLTTCSAVITRGIKVTKTCPVGPTAPGQLLVFSGSVSNTGNITVTNVVVMNNQPAANTLVFTRASLAPGEAASFTGSYVAPTNCSATDTLTATATGSCGVPVSNSASATCPITTTPGITVTEVCPITPGVSGGVSSFSGVVSNSGNITLSNVVVVSDRPAANSVVLTLSSLAPGASANYSGTFTVPLNVCSVTTGVRATGGDSCSGAVVSNSASITCPITTAPAIAVTLVCPVLPSTNGGLITYTGTVLNSGNVTLNNIVVTDSQASPSTVLTIPSLLAGASAGFSASFTAPTNACSVTSIVSVRGSDNCSQMVVSNSASATCALATNPRLIVTQNCPPGAVGPGGLLTYSGTVSNAGSIALTNIVVVNDRSGATPIFTALILLPGRSTNFTGSYTVPAGADCSITSTVTVRGSDNCSGRAVTNAASATCAVNGTPLIAVSLNCPVIPVVTGSAITLSGIVSNRGNVTLVNVTVVNAQASPTNVLALASLAPGASASFSVTIPGASSGFSPALLTFSNGCFATTTVMARGSNVCAAAFASDNATATCGLLTTPAIVVKQTCPVLPVTAGGVLAYSGSVSNAGNITLTNIVVLNSQTGTNVIFTALVLTPGAVSNFTGSYVVPMGALCSISSTSTVTGREICGGASLTNAASSTCTLATAPAIVVTLSCPVGVTAPGGLITYTGTVRNSGNVTLNSVTVVNSQSSPSTVLTLGSLAPEASTNFTASFTAPVNACSVSSSVVARGLDGCTSAVVTHGASATCPLGTAPSISITENCAAATVGPGGTLGFSGTVRNTGNITLTNVIVTSDRTGTTPLLAVATLAAGAVANYAGSYGVPADAGCAITTVVTVTAKDICAGNVAANTASITCPVSGTPRIVVTQTCPLVQASPGAVLTYSGTVSNAGNVTLTNVVVTSDRTGITNVFAIPSLAPRASANFTGSYATHSDCCVDTSTLMATGRDCNNTLARDTSTRTCSLLTRPGILVTLVCPPEMWKPLMPGDVLTYSGTVSNSGNIALTNITLVNTTPTNGIRIFGPFTLAAGESSPYTASFVVPVDFCGTHTVTARGFDACTQLPVTNSASATCPVTTTPGITVTKNCPALPTPHGGLFVFTGSVSNSGNVTLTNVYVVNSQPSNNTPIIGPITLAPGARTNFTGSYTAPLDCCEITDTLTARGQDRCAGSFVTDTATQVCPLLTTPSLRVSIACPALVVGVGGLYEFTGVVTNNSSEVLTNVYVISNLPVTNTVLAGPIELAPGESEFFSGSYIVRAGNPSLLVTASGLDTCQGRLVIAAATCSGPLTSPGQPRALTLIIVGSGTVGGPTNGQILNIGQNYTVTASPAAGTTFVNWSGGKSGTSRALSFTMQSNFVLIATFTSSPSNTVKAFSPVAGTFNGLFFEDSEVKNGNSGYFTFNLTGKGAYTGTLLSEGRKYSVSGKVGADGRATNSITRSRTNAMVVVWEMPEDAPDTISGHLSDGRWTAGLTGDRAVFNTRTNPAPQSGRYTMILRGTPGASDSPEGDGYGTAVVDGNGLVTFAGTLADGTKAAQKGRISRNGHWPVYASLYSGHGAVLGWMTFTNRASDDLAGGLSWNCPPNAKSRRYPAGFGVNSDTLGSRYVAQVGITNRILNVTNGVIILDGGNSPAPSSHEILVGPKSKVTVVGPSKLTFSFTLATGLFKGTCLDADTSRKMSFAGAVMQKANHGSGYFLGTNQSGRVVVRAAP
jgi:uncharacterized repeat protein (TIGR01451 family)